MSAAAEVIALKAEAEGLHVELDRVRKENEALRNGQVSARHHIALALRALNGDLPTTADTNRFHNGG